ncbi:hypothetical protein ACWF2L_39965, partial [Streptomyces anulatus]
MSGVVVHLPRGNGGAVGGGPHGDTVTLRLGPGEAARFGRGSTTAPVELLLDDPAISRLAGEIRVVDDHWQLTNHSTAHSYLVENPEGAGQTGARPAPSPGPGSGASLGDLPHCAPS